MTKGSDERDEHRESAVLVLAAGAGPDAVETPRRCCNDCRPSMWSTRCTPPPRWRRTPCRGGGQTTRAGRARGRSSSPATWAAPSTSRCRSSSSAPATPSAAGSPRCRPIRRHRRRHPGDVPLLDADTLADLIATHSAEPAAVTVLTTTPPDPTGYGRILRTQDGEVIAIVEQADATPRNGRSTRSTPASTPSTRRAASALSRLCSDNAQQRAVPDRRHRDRPRPTADGRAKHVDDTALVPASTTASNWPRSPPN